MSSAELEQRIAALEKTVERLQTLQIAKSVLATATTAAAQSMANNVFTIVQYDTIEYDPDSHITTGASWRFIAKVPGDYLVVCSLLFASTTTWALGEAGSLAVFKNGVQFKQVDRRDEMSSSGTGQYKKLGGSCIVPNLVVGDYIDIRVYQNSGAALTLHTDASFNYANICRIA